MNPKPTLYRVSSLLILTFLLGATQLSAADKTWNGSTSTAWSAAANWTGGVPVAGDNVILTGAGTNRPTNQDIVGLSINSLTINASATAAFIVAGSGITLTGTGTTLTVNTAAANHTLNIPIAMPASQSWDIGANRTLTVGGVISGAGRLTKLGTGTLTLGTATNTYSGGTTITAGRVNIDADSRLGMVPSAVTADSIILNGGGLQCGTNVTLSANRGITLSTAPEGIIDITGNTLVYAGVITGTPRLAKLGGGTLTLQGANTYSGGTRINGGRLNINSDARLGLVPGAFSANDIILDGGGLQSGTTMTLSPNRGITMMTAAEGIIDITGNTFTYAGVIAGTPGLQKAGGGTLVLTGNNTFSGSMNIAGGTLQVNQDEALGAGANVDINSNAQLLAAATFTTARTVGLGPTTGQGIAQIGAIANTTLTCNGVINDRGTGIGHLAKTGAGTLVLAAANLYAGYNEVQLGTLSVTNVSGLGDPAVNSGVIVNATGALDLNFTGATSKHVATAGPVQARGQVQLTNADFRLRGNVTLSAPGAGDTLTINGSISRSVVCDLTFDGAGLITVNGQIQPPNIPQFTNITARPYNTATDYVMEGAAGMNNVSFITAPTSAIINVPTSRVLSFPDDGNFNTLFGVTLANAFTAVIVGDLIIPSGFGPTTYTASTFLNDDDCVCWVDINQDGNFDTGEMVCRAATNNILFSAGSVTLSPGTYKFAYGCQDTGGNSALNCRFELGFPYVPAGNQLAIINNGAAAPGTGVVIKNGSGTLVLAGANTYTASTTVNAGTLRLNGNTGSIDATSALNINSGARFEIDNTSGAGPVSRIGDTVPVNINGGTFAMTAPTNASLVETVGTITYNGSASIELTATGANNCQLTMNDAVNPLPVQGSGLLNLVRTNGTPGTANLYTSTGTDGLNSPFITVNNLGAIYNGNASAGQGLIANSAVVFVTQRDGDWDIAGNNSTAFGPTVAGIQIPNGADITIRHNVRIIGNVQPLLLTFDQNLGGAPYGLRADTARTVGVNRINVSGTVAPILGSNVNIVAGATVLFVNHSGTGVAAINGVISGTAGVTKEGTGTLSLGNAANTFSPSLNIPNGRLEFSGNLGANANTVNLSGGVLACTATNTIPQTLNVTSGEISIGAGLTLTVSNALGAGNGNLLKTGAGTLELSANNTTRSGVTTINDGVLRVLSNQVFGGAGASVVVNTATLSIGTPVAGNPAPLAVNPVQLNDNSRILVDLAVDGTSTAQIGSTLNVAVDADVTVETLVGDGIRLGNITGGSPNSTFTLLAAGRISLNQATTYRGTWISSASTGNVDLKNNASLGNTLNLVRLVAGRFFTNTNGIIIPNPFRLEGGLFGHREGGANSTGTYSGPIEVAGNIDLVVEQDNTIPANAFLNITGSLSGAGSLSLNSARNRVTIANLTSTFSGSITVQATKLLRLAPTGGVSPTMDLPCTINLNGGTLELFNNENTVFSTAVNVNNPSTILADRQGANSNRTLSIDQVTLNGATLTLNGNNGFAMSTPTLAVTAGTTLTANTNLTVSQTLSGAGILSKNGAGTLTLLGDGTAYTATALNIQAGVLVVNNTVGSATGNATVNLNGNTLRGAGTVAGITATTGATVDPGNGAGSPGTLTANGNVTLATGVTIPLQINGATAGTYDRLNVTGAAPTLTLAGATLTLSAPGAVTTTNDILSILPVSGSNVVVGTFANLPQGALIVVGGRLLQISYTGGDGNDVTLTDIGAQQVGVRVVPTALTIPEAGPAQTFSVVLTQAPLSNVVIDIANTLPAEGTLGSSQLTFTTTNWNQLQTVSVTPINDLVDDGDTVLTAQLTVNAAGSSNEYDPVNPADVVVTIVDDDTAGITVTAPSVVTTESGGQGTFTVRLNSQPTSPVTINLTSSDLTEGTVTASLTFAADSTAVNPQTVTVTGVDDLVADGTIAYTIVTAPATSADSLYNGLDAADASVTNTDNDTVGVVNSQTTITTTEGGAAATFTVRLASQPFDVVTVTLTSNDLTEGQINGVNPIVLTFQPDATALTPQTVTITPQEDLLDDGNIPYTITYAVASTGDPAYNGLAAGPVNVTNNDNDVSSVAFSRTTVTTAEGGAVETFTVNLTAQPTDVVTVTLTSNDLTEGQINGVNPLVLTFQPNATALTPQTVTITPQEDLLDDGDIAYTITGAVASTSDANYNGQTTTVVNVTNTDNDTVGFTFSRVAVDTIEGGVVEQFTVRLNSQPFNPVTLTLTSGDLTEGQVNGANPLVLTFNADATALNNQTVSITPQNDALIDGMISYSITTAVASSDSQYSALTTPTIAVRNFDDDEGTFITPTTLSTSEAAAPGGSQSFTLALSTVPSAPVTITVTGLNSEGLLSTSTLVFAANETALTAQTVSVTPVDDLIDDGDVTYNITFSVAAGSAAEYIGLLIPSVSVTNADNDAASVTVTPTTLATMEGGPAASFGITLGTQPTADVVIALTNGDTTEGTLSVPSLTFTPANWNVAQTVTVAPVADSVTDGNVTYSIVTTATSSDLVYNGLTVADVTVTNTDEPAPVISSALSVAPSPATVGVPVTLTFAASDPQGQPVTVTFDYGDGTNGTATTHTYTVPQIVTLTATVTDGVNVLTSSFTLTVLSAASPDADVDRDGLPNSQDLDDDNDGFSDVIEIAAGTDQFNAGSSPGVNNGPAGTPGPLPVTKMAIQLNFGKANLDRIQMSGTLNIPAGFVVANQKVVVDVGGVARSFILNAKGQSPRALDTFKLSVKSSGGVVPLQVGKWSLKFNKGSYSASLADEGLTNATITKQNRTVKVQMVFNQRLLERNVIQSYSSKAGKSGKTSSPK